MASPQKKFKVPGSKFKVYAARKTKNTERRTNFFREDVGEFPRRVIRHSIRNQATLNPEL
jgi:hypothetical protein